VYRKARVLAVVPSRGIQMHEWEERLIRQSIPIENAQKNHARSQEGHHESGEFFITP
jgi:hypothetical protein